jgi:acyl-coenzyme A synthetase/AMP-(fatty) acid ligase
VVVARPDGAPSQAELVEHARRQLAGYKCPRTIRFIEEEEMPRTATGKILHRMLRDRFGGRTA